MGKSHIAGWTSESPTPAQLAEFFRQIKGGRVTKDRLQKFLRGGDLLVSVDLIRSWGAMVEAGGYDYVSYIDVDFDADVHLPPFPLGQRNAEISLRRQDYSLTAAQWLSILDDEGDSQEMFAHPFTVLAIGADADYGDEQRESPIFTIWRDPTMPQLWLLVLYGDITRRNLQLRRVPLTYELQSRYRAAAVIK